MIELRQRSRNSLTGYQRLSTDDDYDDIPALNIRQKVEVRSQSSPCKNCRAKLYSFHKSIFICRCTVVLSFFPIWRCVSVNDTYYGQIRSHVSKIKQYK